MGSPHKEEKRHTPKRRTAEMKELLDASLDAFDDLKDQAHFANLIHGLSMDMLETVAIREMKPVSERT
jgi:hypothetical protein